MNETGFQDWDPLGFFFCVIPMSLVFVAAWIGIIVWINRMATSRRASKSRPRGFETKPFAGEAPVLEERDRTHG